MAQLPGDDRQLESLFAGLPITDFTGAAIGSMTADIEVPRTSWLRSYLGDFKVRSQL
jgi:hypothetical protein